jgi:multidrug efflux pump subunit AcrA (membrane-fusion protein)
VPGAILGGGAALLLVTGRDALSTAPEVAVSPAVTIATMRSSAQASDAAGVIQAPGWIEPAPYADEVRALREGVVAGVHVLEGGRVARGDLLVTLEHRAEELALARAEAEIGLAEAGIPGHEATLRATERALALALDSDRALRTAESALATAESAGTRLDAEVAEADALEREVRDELERKKALADAGAASVGDDRVRNFAEPRRQTFRPPRRLSDRPP